MTDLSVAAVRVVDRHRSDAGDLSSLVQSIERVGLLHPIVVDGDGRLIAGGRRLEAFRQMGRKSISATVVTNLADARALLEAERDENTCRLDMKPSEKVALGLALEELERPAAAERMTLGKLSPGSESRGDRTGKVYDLVGEAVGMSGPTYKRAKAVVAAAQDGQPGAAEALAQMDESGKVTPAYDKVRSPRGTFGGKARPALGTTRGQQYANRDAARVRDLVNTIAGLVMTADEIDYQAVRELMPPDELIHIVSTLKSSIATLRGVRSNLTNGEVK